MIIYIVSDAARFLKHSHFIIALLTAFNDLMGRQDELDYEAIMNLTDGYMKRKIFSAPKYSNTVMNMMS